jgi:hypothetical protein
MGEQVIGVKAKIKIKRDGKMEEFLRRENLKLMVENIRLRNQLEKREQAYMTLEELEKQYEEYYLDDTAM